MEQGHEGGRGWSIGANIHSIMIFIIDSHFYDSSPLSMIFAFAVRLTRPVSGYVLLCY